MKKIIIFLPFFYSHVLFAQTTNDYWAVDTGSSFISANSPYTDAISIWVLRQNLTIRAYQAYINSDFGLTNTDLSKTNNAVELYLPVVTKGGFTAMLGTGYSRNYFMSEKDSLNDPVMGFNQLWVPLQYNFNKWRITILYERLLAGKSNSLFDDVGNTQRLFAMVSHSFNLKWCLTVFGVYYEDNMENAKNTTLVPAIQLRYKPNKNVTMAAGAPLLFGIEWSVTPKIDIYFSQVMLDETNSFISYNFTDKLGLTLHYNSVQKGSDTYFYSESVSFSGNEYSYNHIVQRQSNIALKLGFKTFKHVGVFLSGGYKIGDKLNLYNNEDKITKIDGESDIFVGFNLQYLKYF